MLCKKGVLRNFTKFTGKHLCQGLFFNKCFYKTPLVAASESSNCKNLSSVYVVKICFVKMFFTPCDNWKTLFFIKVYRCRGDLFNRYVFVLFEKSGFKEVRILFLISTKECSANIKMINSKIKFKNKCLVYHTSYIFCTTFNF